MASKHSKRYNVVHKKTRARVRRTVDAGTASCVRCGQPILPGSDWDLDHNDDGRGHLGPAHRWCNRSVGGRRGQQRRLEGRRLLQFSSGSVWSRCWCGDERDPRCPDAGNCNALRRGSAPSVA
jgi:hypothetical protein